MTIEVTIAGVGLENVDTNGQTLGSEAGGRDFFETGYPVTQNGFIDKVLISVRNSPATFKVKAWRPTAGTYVYLGQSETFAEIPVGLETVTLATPIAVQAGDVVSIWLGDGKVGRSNDAANGGTWSGSASDLTGDVLISSISSAISGPAYIGVIDVLPAQSITSVDGDNTVTDGQQSVPVIVTGFTGDVTSASLRVGANTIPLTGLAGTGDNYTVNFPDVAAFTVDTAGLPFSSGAYQNEVVVTDGTDTAAINITREPKAGYTVVETISATAVKGSIFESRVGGAPFDGSQIYYSTAGNTTISATGIITTDLTTLTAHVWDVTSGNWELMTFNGINIGGFFPSITNTVTKVNAAVFIPKIYRGSN
jgi:hypothetical protein